MPSNMLRASTRSKTRSLQARALEAAKALDRRTTLQARGPWAGYTPDLDVHLTSLSHASDIGGLIARPSIDGQGEVLTFDDGFQRVRPTELHDGASAVLGTEPVVHLTEFLYTSAAGLTTADTYGLLPIAIQSGDGTPGSDTGKVFRIRPDSLIWQAIPHSNNVVAMLQAGAQRETGTTVWDSATFAFGCPERQQTNAVWGGNSGGDIDEPCLIWCTGSDPVTSDPVFVYPAGNGLLEYEDLLDIDAGGADPFYATSVENYNSRAFYFNTAEVGGTRHRQRLRWSPPFDADPTPGVAGAGALDMREFSLGGLRIETLGDLLACYFEDGVALARTTGQLNFPVTYSVLTRTRGLISTGAVTPLGANQHFCIMTDGWFVLDSSGRWTEVGLADAGGASVTKWKRAFYDKLDVENRHKLLTFYDQTRALVYISLPVVGTTDPEDIWIFDPLTDRVWRDTYQATAWGSFTRSAEDAVTWANAIGTWVANPYITWGQSGPAPSLRAAIHGDAGGLVFQHESSIFEKDGATPTFFYDTPKTSSGDPRHLHTLDRVMVEGLNLVAAGTGTPVTVTATAQNGATEANTVRFDRNNAGTVEVDSAYFRATDEEMVISLSGSHPHAIRSFEADVFVQRIERRHT